MRRAFSVLFLIFVMSAGAASAAGDYLCQSMLVRLQADKAKAILEASGERDAWSAVAEEMKSGQVEVLAAPSVLTKSGMRVVTEGKVAQMSVELNAMEPGTCDLLIEFKSSHITVKTGNSNGRFTLGRSVVLAGDTSPESAGAGLLLVFRVVAPGEKGF